MRKLRELDRAKLLEYLSAEPEMNMFFYGDVENNGFDSDICEIFALEQGGEWGAVALRYFKNYVIYSRKDNYDCEAVRDFLLSRDELRVISGKASVLEPLKKFFPGFKFSSTYMSRCNEAAYFEHKAQGVSARRLTEQDAMDVVKLFCRIDEWKDDYLGREEEKAEEERKNIRSGGTKLGFFHGDQLVSCAGTTAENSRGAMVIGVATLPEWRGQGLASANVSKLCRMHFEAGREFLCLFYNNPAAGRIYHKIGFKEIGLYTLGKTKKEEQQ